MLGCVRRHRLCHVDALRAREVVTGHARAHVQDAVKIHILMAPVGNAIERLEVAAHAGSPDPSSDDEAMKLIRAHRTQILLVAFVAPRQELWIDRLKDRLDIAVGIGVGGAFDYLTGRVRRAPSWMRRAGLEWLFRLAQQPWRARRMAVLPVYAVKVLSAGK